MGNKQTSIKIDEYFEEIEYKNDKIKQAIKFIIELDQPAVTCEGEEISKFIFLFENDEVNILRAPSNIEDIYVWNPKSHMRDFEVLWPFTKKQVKIARGQGIGVFISDIHKFYIKLVYDKNEKLGVKFFLGGWNHTNEARDLLSNDLYLGYNVLILNNKFNNLVEPKDKRDDHETTIIFKSLENYASYDHGKRKREPEEDKVPLYPRKKRKIEKK